MDENSPWGMVLHSASEWDISELHKGGVAFLRVDFRWETLQPNGASQPFVWTHFDRIVRWAADRQMYILAGLGGTPRWAVDPNRMNADGNRYRADAYPPANLALWDNYVRQVVTRYGARGVRYWGIWNEPDSFNEPVGVCFWRGTQQEFFDGVCQRAVDIIRGLGTHHRICVADLAKSQDPGPWLNPLLARFGRNIHAASIHAYSGGGDGSDVVDRARISRRIVDAYNAANATQVQLWITETGWHRSQHSESTISSKIQDLVREVRGNSWVRKVFPYVWSDSYEDAYDFKAYTRLTRQQWAGYKAAINAPQPELPLERDALLVSHTVPATMRAGIGFFAQMTFRNLGRVTWQPGGPVQLGFGSKVTTPGLPYTRHAFFPDSGLIETLGRANGIIAPVRTRIQTATPVARGGEVRFEFSIATPSAPGFYLIGWCMVDDSEGLYFGQGWLQKLYVN